MKGSGKEIHAEHPLLIDKLWFWWRFVVHHRLYQKNTRNWYHLFSVLPSCSPISHPKFCCVKLRMRWVQPLYSIVSLYLASKTLLGQKQTAPEPQLANTSVTGINLIQRVLLMLLLMTTSLGKKHQSHKAEWFSLDPSSRFRILHCLIQQSLLNHLNPCLVLPIQPLNPPNLREFSRDLSLLVKWSFQRTTPEWFLTGLTQELLTYLITASLRVAVLILDALLLQWKMCFYLTTPVIPLKTSWASVFTAIKILDRIWTSTYTGNFILFFCIHPSP